MDQPAGEGEQVKVRGLSCLARGCTRLLLRLLLLLLAVAAVVANNAFNVWVVTKRPTMPNHRVPGVSWTGQNGVLSVVAR